MATKRNQKIKLGDKVRDTVTGFTGVTISYTEYLDCNPSWGVLGDALNNGVPVGQQYIDAWRIELAPKKVKK